METTESEVYWMKWFSKSDYLAMLDCGRFSSALLGV